MMNFADENLWIKSVKNPDRPIFSKETIARFNSSVTKDIFSRDTSVPFERFEEILRACSEWKNCNAYKIKESISEVEKCGKFALTVSRTQLRSLPFKKPVFERGDFEIDRLQETGLEIGEPMKVLLCSKNWLYAVLPFYDGWIEKKFVAFGDKWRIRKFYLSKKFFIVTGNYVYTLPSRDRDISMKMFGMGAKLANGRAGQIAGELHTNQFVIKIPVRKSGSLAFKNAFLNANSDVSEGYLPPTRRSIVTEALKLLGEPYGWGDSFEARDCSSTVRSIYKTVGIYLPRNAKEQEQISLGKKVDFSGKSIKEKLEMLDMFSPGDLLFMKGHVMMYFGKVNGVHYIFHNFHGKYEKGERISVNSALITPVDILFSKKRSAISEIRTGIIMKE